MKALNNFEKLILKTFTNHLINKYNNQIFDDERIFDYFYINPPLNCDFKYYEILLPHVISFLKSNNMYID